MTSNGSPLILVADDQDFVLSVTEKILSRCGFTVVTARSGDEALATFEPLSDRVSLVLLDWVMPGLEASETVASLRRIRADVRIFLLSGYLQSEAASLLASGEVDGFIEKPFTAGELAGRVRAALDVRKRSAAGGAR